MLNQLSLSLQTIPVLLLVAVLGLALACGAVILFDRCLWPDVASPLPSWPTSQAQGALFVFLKSSAWRKKPRLYLD